MTAALTTRLLKAQCGDCAYTVRITRKWLAELGPPLCPCNRLPLECAQYEDIEERCRLEVEAWEATALEVKSTTLREKWTIARIPHDCTRCHGRTEIGEEYYRHTYSVGGELITEKLCLRCKCRATGARRTVGRA